MRRNSFAALIPLLLVPRLAAPQGEPLGPEFRVNTATPSSQGYAAVAAIGDDFVVVWHSFPQGIVGQRYSSSGDPLGTEFRVNTNTSGTLRNPAVAANASGSFIVVWQSVPPGCGPPCPPPVGYKVYGQRFAVSGAPVGPEFVVSPIGYPYQRYPVVAVAPSGAFLVAWNTQFSQAPPGPSDVFAQIYDSSGLPQGPGFRVNTYTPFYQRVGSVAADPAGNFVVVWSNEYQSSKWHVSGQRYAPTGAPLGPEFRVNTDAAAAPTWFGSGPAVATDSSGNFVVAWGSDSGSPAGPGLFGQRFASSGVPLGPEFRVNASPAAGQNEPAIAVDGGGNFVIAWVDAPTSSEADVFGQRYSSLGEPSGPEFRVNTTTTGWQRNPSVASTPGGIFLVTWQSGPAGFIPDDVFGQRFGGVFPVELQDFRLK